MKTEKMVKVEPNEAGIANAVVTKMENNENNQIIELSNIIEGEEALSNRTGVKSHFFFLNEINCLEVVENRDYG